MCVYDCSHTQDTDHNILSNVRRIANTSNIRWQRMMVADLLQLYKSVVISCYWEFIETKIFTYDQPQICTCIWTIEILQTQLFSQSKHIDTAYNNRQWINFWQWVRCVDNKCYDLQQSVIVHKQWTCAKWLGGH